MPHSKTDALPAAVRKPAKVLVLTLALAVSGLVAPSCGSDEASLETLVLRVTSDAPAGVDTLDTVRFVISGTDAAGDRVRVPPPGALSTLTVEAGEAFDPVAGEQLVAIEYGGETFAEPTVDVLVIGRVGTDVATAWSGTLDLSERRIVDVHLAAISQACDADGDGFLDCSIAGCCAEGGAQLSDCEPDEATAHLWQTADPCGDGIDADCDGTDPVCNDGDSDGYGPDLDCDDTNPDVHPGVSEVCNGIDDDCDGSTDEGFTFEGTAVGGSCGVGACSGGTVECAEDGTSATCTTTDVAGLEEDCTNALDDDCNGKINDGCGDFDGDGLTVDQGDCNDGDSGIFLGADEPCCQEEPGTSAVQAVCDKNCDGDVEFCKTDDADGDGQTTDSDCDDTDPLVYFGAPEKCGDGIDQDCVGGDEACAGKEDADGDGWSPPTDCDDGDPSVNPEAAEVCDAVDNDCDGYIDDGNPAAASGAEVPGEVCGTDVGECQTGIWTCLNTFEGAFQPGQMGCYQSIAPVDEVCDLLDNNCDGVPDDGFLYGGNPIGSGCDGEGACGGGSVECADLFTATCSTNPNGSTPQDGEESCNGLDDDCDGTTDEDLTDALQSDCALVGVCEPGSGGVLVKATCRVDPPAGGFGWDCDYSEVPNYDGAVELSCDGLDNDCDGTADDDFDIGAGCDGDDADSCPSGLKVCNAAGTGWTCDEDPNAVLSELCDGLDNDCDGSTDEDYPLGQACGVGNCLGGVLECTADFTGTQCSTMPAGEGQELAGSEDASGLEDCDGADDDCDGAIDESFITLGASCDGPDSDLCKHGAVACKADGTGVECAGETQIDLVEDCDNSDDDCDGQIDEGLDSIVDAGCANLGACETDVTASCKAGSWTCTYNHPDYQAGDEVGLCDLVDNDCDGSTDEDFGASGSVTYLAADGSARVLGEGCGFGACEGGQVVCGPAGDTLICTTIATNQSVEVCDNIDNDCDVAVDEDLTDLTQSDCALTGVCTLDNASALCTAGAWACSYDTPDHDAAVDACDGLDNNCDGTTDEDFPTKGASCDTDADEDLCENGVLVCNAAGDGLECSAEDPLEVVEVCNGLDDDCDGVIDEGFDFEGALFGEACEGVGECGAGTVECADEATSRCSANPGGTDYVLVVELCNGLDDDCDGVADDLFLEGGGAAPYTELDGSQGGFLNQPCGLGECSGTVVCDADELSLSCEFSVAPAGADTCDGLDEDCDGLTDEDYADKGAECDGDDDDQCANGTWTCNDSADGLECINESATFAEACDELDNDCDGETDEDFTDLGQACDGDDDDSCALGTVVCEDLFGTHCEEIGQQIDELCDELDNDCDGETDEDFADLGTACDGADLDECDTGTVVCDELDPALTRCEETESFVEMCNDDDDDCDGSIDETFPDLGELCDTADSDECANGQFECNAEMTDVVCLSELVTDIVEECGDDTDNDCDGATDEDCPTGCGELGIECPAGWTCDNDGYCVDFSSDGDDSLFATTVVPGTTFTRGCVACDDGTGVQDCSGDTDAPAQSITVSTFAIDRHEVSELTYCECKAAGNCLTLGAINCNLASAEPVVGVSHGNATTICSAMGKRLCTEAEWELAARGPSEGCYPWGAAAPSCSLATMKDAAGDGCGAGTHAETGAVPGDISWVGAFDLGGNAREWLSDLYSETYYTDGDSTDPAGPDVGAERVTRGGGWADEKLDITSWRRRSRPAATTQADIGFRCCKDVP